jgi:hypothetical protein
MKKPAKIAVKPITITVPRAWKALLELPEFDLTDNPPEKWRSIDQSPRTLAKHVSDPRPWRDDDREVSVAIEGRIYTAKLASGSANYFLSAEIVDEKSGEVVSLPDDDVSHDLPCEQVVELFNGTKVEIQVTC